MRVSVDWCKYANAEIHRLTGRKRAAEYAVARLIAEAATCLERQTVEHTPDIDHRNRAHTEIVGPKPKRPVAIGMRTDIRAELARAATWAIRLPDPVADVPLNPNGAVLDSYGPTAPGRGCAAFAGLALAAATLVALVA